jgi:hypothetical protein
VVGVLLPQLISFGAYVTSSAGTTVLIPARNGFGHTRVHASDRPKGNRFPQQSDPALQKTRVRAEHVRVTQKPEYGWTPRKYKEREIPVCFGPHSLSSRLPGFRSGLLLWLVLVVCLPQEELLHYSVFLNLMKCCR